MNSLKSHCDPALLSRFFDGELGPDEQACIRAHLKECFSCQKALIDHQRISALFKTISNGAASQAKFDDIEEGVMSQIRKDRDPWWLKFKAFFLSKKLLVPATAFTAAFIILFSLLRAPLPESGPSAIINSFTGEISSVIIMETPESRQTIIWFNETGVGEGIEDDGTQETLRRFYIKRACFGTGSPYLG